jgi:hypothetical protein
MLVNAIILGAMMPNKFFFISMLVQPRQNLHVLIQSMGANNRES